MLMVNGSAMVTNYRASNFDVIDTVHSEEEIDDIANNA